jgi:hypothetical protein
MRKSELDALSSNETNPWDPTALKFADF